MDLVALLIVCVVFFALVGTLVALGLGRAASRGDRQRGDE